MQLLANQTMSKKEAALRVGCFLAVYSLFSWAPVILFLVPPSWVPHIIENFLWNLPAWTFPFCCPLSANGEDYVFTGPIVTLFTVVHLALLGFLFLKLVQPIRKWLWSVPLAFCFSALSIFALQILFMVFGINLHIRSD